MVRAYYRFRHEIALRLSNGQAFSLRDAELGAHFGDGVVTVGFLRGVFTAGTFRSLIARGLVAPNAELVALALPIAVQLELKSSWDDVVGKDASALQMMGRRLEQNIRTDELARQLLMFDEWRLVSALAVTQPAVQPAKVAAKQSTLTKSTFASTRQAEPVPVAPSPVTQLPSPADLARQSAMQTLMSEMADELWTAAEEAGQPLGNEALDLETAVRYFFATEEWACEDSAENVGLLRAAYDGENGSWICYTQILRDLDQVIFYSVCPITVPSSSLPIMSEYLCRVNADLTVGNFELDFEVNVVRFRTGVDVTDVGLGPLLFRNVVFHNLAVMDFYLPELMEIMMGRQSAVPKSTLVVAS